MGIELSGAGLRTERLQCPLLASFLAAENVGVTVIGSDAKIHVVRSVPLILDGFDEEYDVPEPELDRTLIGFVTGIAFDSNFHVTLFQRIIYVHLLFRQYGLALHPRCPAPLFHSNAASAVGTSRPTEVVRA